MTVSLQGAGRAVLARSERIRNLALYVGFAATGVGVALPGAVLPVLIHRGHLSDAQAGRLFLMAWIGSSLGALLVRGSLRWALAAGAAAVAMGAVGLAANPGPPLAVGALLGLYGLGLGLTMTSISLIQEQAWHAQSGLELVRLNLLWAVGALLCPALAAPALRTSNVRPQFGGVAAVFLMLALWAGLRRQLQSITPVQRDRFLLWTLVQEVPLRLIVMTMLITGVEASAGGWLTTYARRLGEGVAGAVLAPTCLWAGLLLSRLFWSWRGDRVSSSTIVLGSVTAVAFSAVALCAWGAVWSVLPAALVMGFGIGPVYPLVLAEVLRRLRTGSIFFLAGVGAACLPWATGAVSSTWHSLRLGLMIPAAAALALVLAAWTSPPGGWSKASEGEPQS